MSVLQWFKQVFTSAIALSGEMRRKRYLRVAKLLLIASAGALMIMPEIAAAAPWDAAVTAVSSTLQGTLGKTIAIVAVIALGMMAMAGKLEWAHAIKVVVGIVIMFSAAQIINWIAPSAGLDAKDTAALSAVNQTACTASGVGGIWIGNSLGSSDAAGHHYTDPLAAHCVPQSQAAVACASRVVGLTFAQSADKTPTVITYDTYTPGASSCAAGESYSGGGPYVVGVYNVGV